MPGDDAIFEWDERKRLLALEKHRLDFRRAPDFFAAPLLVGPARSDDEPRQLAIGWLDGIVVVCIFTRRGDAIRVITMRRARPDERARHSAVYGQPASPDEG